MVGKKSGKAQLREEGLEKTDNNLAQTSWPIISMINQKNYYTEYLKREDQYLAYRTLQEENTNRLVREARDRDRSRLNDLGLLRDAAPPADEDVIMEESEPYGSKIVVIHPGSQYLRIGFANDALPRTVPMVIARRWKENEAEENGGEPLPKRLKSDDDPAEKWFGDEFSTQYTTMSGELRTRMRNSRVRLTPNAKDLVIGGNKKHWRSPEYINEHNDPNRIEWTEIPDRGAPDFIAGPAALRIPENSKPRYKLFWPLRHGWLNEKDYKQKNMLLNDYFKIIDEAMRTELGVTHRKDLTQYSCVFVIPDLYEKNFVATILDEFMRDFGFKRVCFIQESLAASFGAGYSISCVVDVGAQKTSICCVEDGMCVEDSRVNLKYGGMDVTELFMKMMLYDYFPYADINLKRRYDFLLADELKQKYTHMNERDIVNVITNDFHVRAAGQDTCKFQLKVYDSPMLAPMAYFQPKIFDFEGRLDGRRTLLDRSYDLYDSSPNDPTSAAQVVALQYASQNIAKARVAPEEPTTAPAAAATATPARERSFLLGRFNQVDLETTPRSSVAGSPAPDARAGSPAAGAAGENGAAAAAGGASADPLQDRMRAAEESDRVLPVMPLDAAIIASVRQAARGDDRKMRDFLGGVMVVGGGAKMPGFNQFLEVRLREGLPGFTKEIMVGVPPRELDQQLVVWKGGSVFGRLSSTGNDSWVHRKEYGILGAKLLIQKLMFAY